MSATWRRAARWTAVAAWAWVVGSAGYGAVVPPAVLVECTVAHGCRAHEDAGDLAVVAAAGAPWAAATGVVAVRRRRRGGAQGPAPQPAFQMTTPSRPCSLAPDGPAGSWVTSREAGMAEQWTTSGTDS